MDRNPTHLGETLLFRTMALLHEARGFTVRGNGPYFGETQFFRTIALLREAREFTVRRNGPQTHPPQRNLDFSHNGAFARDV